MLKECMDIHGSNPIALHRISQAAEIIRLELYSRFNSGEATWAALQRGVKELVSRAPRDHDVLIQVNDIAVLKAEFVPPHTLFFEGINSNGHHAGIVIHFSKLDARVVYRPKAGPTRIITGFADGRT